MNWQSDYKLELVFNCSRCVEKTFLSLYNSFPLQRTTLYFLSNILTHKKILILGHLGGEVG